MQSIIEDLRTHALDDCGGKAIPTHIANQPADILEACKAALTEIRELVSKRQLPITNQVYEIADATIARMG